MTNRFAFHKDGQQLYCYWDIQGFRFEKAELSTYVFIGLSKVYDQNLNDLISLAVVGNPLDSIGCGIKSTEHKKLNQYLYEFNQFWITTNTLELKVVEDLFPIKPKEYSYIYAV